MRITESDFIRRTTATDYAKTTWYKLGRWNLSVILRRAMLKVAFWENCGFCIVLDYVADVPSNPCTCSVTISPFSATHSEIHISYFPYKVTVFFVTLTFCN